MGWAILKRHLRVWCPDLNECPKNMRCMERFADSKQGPEPGQDLLVVAASNNLSDCLLADEMMRRAQGADGVVVVRPLRRIERVLDLGLIASRILQPPDPPCHVALVITAIPVRDQQVAVRVEGDVAGAEVRVGTAQQR